MTWTQEAPIRFGGSLAECTDFERLGRAPIKKFVTVTNVRTGQGHLFRNCEITPDVLLAPTCLPTMFQAFEIGGENYWDGGYSSKLNAEWDFLCMLRDAGLRSANYFLDAHGADLERSSSYDIDVPLKSV